MLSKIEVDGYRSLRNFSLEISPGLNVLVGPNGAGKTNIVSFFEFLSYLAERSLADAVLSSGGANRLFDYQDRGLQQGLSFKIEGLRQIESPGRLIRYCYSANIKISSETQFIYFSSQSLQLSLSDSKGIFRISKKGSNIFDFDVDCKASENTRSKVSVNKINKSRIRHHLFYPLSDIEGKKIDHGFDRRLEIEFERYDPAVFCLLSIGERFMGDLRVINRDLISGRAYNIVPSVAKSREDVSTPVGVRPDGAGLSATLFMLQQLSERLSSLRPQPPRIYSQRESARVLAVNPRQFAEIVDYIKLVNRNISGIRVDVDTLESFIRVSLILQTPSENIRVPLQNVSDGTAKWLALVTAILTSRTIFAIEEPENFLHPHMQQEIISIFRETSNRSGLQSFVLMTTHSETLISALRPEEIITVMMVDAQTVARRIESPELVKSEINKTGFGLAFYYLAGALDDA